MPVERNGDVFILGTVDDITEETQLRKRLEEAGARRQEEMRSFFEVVHMDSSILAAFTEDAAHNLEAGLALLQDVSDPESTSASSDTETVLVSLYQLLHAVKSDAYIVGLSVYGDKLHSTESEIKRLRESDTPPSPDDFAALTSQLERLLDEKDALINILEQLHAPVPAVKQDEVAVLSASLKRACERVAADLGKQARFEPLAIDAEAVKSVPRRQLKEILIQLVRNAVYHGIEAPEQRRAAAKDETGVIQLSIQRRATLVASTAELSHSGELAITIKDDGAGLNFDKIRRKALDQGLIDKDVADDSTENQLLRVLFLPGFSTAETSGAHAGRGIGLNMVRDQVRALSGSIKVRTERGKGTAFVVSLPL
jgi:chemotaxis protein histidine kinase CheA